MKNFNVLQPKQFKNTFPKSFAGADTETNANGKAVIFSIAGINKQGEYYENVFEEHNWLEMQRRAEQEMKMFTNIYFHYLEFDLNALYGASWLENFETIFRQYGALITKIDKKTKLIDSTAILPRKLEELAKIVNMKKIDVKGKFLNKKYCLKDSIILYNVLKKFFQTLQENDIPFSYTLPTIFLKYFQATALRTKVTNLPLVDLKFCRKAYKGGRNEIYKIGKHEKVYVYDIKSLYPFAMKNMRLAIPSYYKSDTEIKPYQDFFQIINCKVEVPDVYIPPLAIKRKKLIFPTGVFSGYFTNNEINELYKIGGKVLQVEKIYTFDYYKINFFETIIDKLFELKNNAKTEAESFIFKIILNGGYGKFAQWIYQTEYNKETKLLERVEQNEVKYFANQIWSIQIADFARMYYYSFLKRFQNDLIYGDTDSLHMKRKMPEKWIGNNLGQFVLEKSGNAEYKRCKIYRIGEEYKFKGVPKIFQKEAFEKGEIEYLRANKIKSHLRYGHLLNVFEKNMKQIRAKYDKRIVLENNDTKPLFLKNED